MIKEPTQRVPVDVPRDLYERMNAVVAHGTRSRLLIALMQSYVTMAEKSPKNAHTLAALVIEGKVQFICPTMDLMLEVEDAIK